MLLFGQPWSEGSVVKDAIAATVYVPNLWFAFLESDYLAQDAPSPLLHYWSLGIEEQFYAVVPVVLVVAWALTRRSLRGLAWFIGTATVASFAYAWWLSSTDAVLAFYHPGARAWELSAGVAAALAVHLGAVPQRSRAVQVWRACALALLVAWIVWGTDSVAWPGPATLVPVVASVVLVWLGASGGADRGWWQWRPLQSLGDWSYSLYLWHWPVLVLVAAWLPGERGILEAVAIALLSVILAAASYRWVEQPTRRVPVRTATQRRRVFGWSAAGLVVVLAAAGLLAHAAQRELEPEEPVLAAGTKMRDPLVISPSPQATPSLPAGDGEIPGVVRMAPAEFASSLPADVRPALTQVRGDNPRVYRDDCHLGRGEHEISDACLYGDQGPLVAVFGDSHVAQWLAPLLSGADEGRWRVLSLTSSACPAMPLQLAADAQRANDDCDPWRDAALAAIDTHQPEVILVSTMYHHQLAPQVGPRSHYVAMTRTLLERLPTRAQLVWIADTPWMGEDPAECAEAQRENLSVCAVPREEALNEPLAQAMQDEVLAAGGMYLDPTPALCDEHSCGVVVDDMLVWRDHHHITVTYTRHLQGVLLETVNAAAREAADADQR
jgi:peptidoglycan/LPS O-acetylase OafA/YrhL